MTFLEMWNAVRDKDENDTEFEDEQFWPKYPYDAQQKRFIQL